MKIRRKLLVALKNNTAKKYLNYTVTFKQYAQVVAEVALNYNYNATQQTCNREGDNGKNQQAQSKRSNN